jgi:hypothetical protein
MKRSSLILTQTMLLAAGLLAGAAASAATVTQTGADFDLSYDSSLLGRYGAPVLNGNTIAFSPSGFKAESSGGNGEFITDQTLNLQLTLHAGKTVSGITLLEQGQYTLSGKQSDVYMWGEFSATAGAAPAISQGIAPNGYFSPNTGNVLAWSSNTSLDFSGVSATSQANGIALSLQTALQAYTRPSDVGLRVASIDMTGSPVLTVSTVPEPESLALALVGLGLLTRFGRGRQSDQN